MGKGRTEEENALSCIILFGLIVLGVLGLIRDWDRRETCFIIDEPVEYVSEDDADFRIYFKANVSSDCGETFSDKDMYIEYIFSNKVLFEDTLQVLSYSYNVSTPTSCYIDYHEDVSIEMTEWKSDKLEKVCN